MLPEPVKRELGELSDWLRELENNAWKTVEEGAIARHETSQSNYLPGSVNIVDMAQYLHMANTAYAVRTILDNLSGRNELPSGNELEQLTRLGTVLATSMKGKDPYLLEGGRVVVDRVKKVMEKHSARLKPAVDAFEKERNILETINKNMEQIEINVREGRTGCSFTDNAVTRALFGKRDR